VGFELLRIHELRRRKSSINSPSFHLALPIHLKPLLTPYTQPFWASIVFYQLTITFTKISILLQYFRIFVTSGVRRACWITLSIVIAYGIWSVISAIFMCAPVPYFWNKTIQEGKCLPEQPVWFGNAALNIVTDVAILALPMPVLGKLRLPRRQKVGLMLVLGLGGV
jgi:hypothetical protein